MYTLSDYGMMESHSCCPGCPAWTLCVAAPSMSLHTSTMEVTRLTRREAKTTLKRKADPGPERRTGAGSSGPFPFPGWLPSLLRRGAAAGARVAQWSPNAAVEEAQGSGRAAWQLQGPAAPPSLGSRSPAAVEHSLQGCHRAATYWWRRPRRSRSSDRTWRRRGGGGGSGG